MTTTRRAFLQTSALAGTFLPLGLAACSSLSGSGSQAARRQRILILGGTGFLGPALIDAVLARGHELSLFNSGRTEGLRAAGGRPSVVPDGVEVLLGNRDPLLTADDRRLQGDPDIESKRDPNSPKGLEQLHGKQWNAVIDTSGYFPRMVRASAELLAPNVQQYVFVSTLSVYVHNDIVDMDESGELAVLEDPDIEEFGENWENYGGGKAACEAAAEAAMPGRTTNVRPGYIVGPRDSSRRFTYWPWRVAQGATMLVPGTPEDPIQIIDVRDLAEWIVHCTEEGHVGAYNATGPAEMLTMRRMLEACRSASGADTGFTWADAEFVREHEIPAPIWAPPDGEFAGFHRTSIAKALAAGLTFRSTEETARATLAWHESLPPEYQERLLPPHSLEKEALAVEAWKEAQG